MVKRVMPVFQNRVCGSVSRQVLPNASRGSATHRGCGGVGSGWGEGYVLAGKEINTETESWFGKIERVTLPRGAWDED